MADRRLTPVSFLGVWAALVALQGLALTAPFVAMGAPAQVAWVALIQAAKVLPTAWRLNDGGRDPSDAVLLALLPVVNIAGFFSRMIEKTPSEKLRARRRAQWEGRLGAFAAVGHGLWLVKSTLLMGTPLALGYAVVSAAGGVWMLGRLDWAQTAGASSLGTAIQGLWLVAGVLGLYTLLQLMKRKTASRASWAPTLLLAPVVMTGGAFTLLANGMGQELGPLVLSLLLMAWNLVWASFGGAALAVGQVMLADRASRGESMSAGELVGAVRDRTLDVAGPHGARQHAVTIGMQVVLPGIFYALQLAFVDLVAVLEPKEAALARSGRLTWGMRSRLFKVFLLWFLASMGASAAIGYALESPEAFAASFFDPRAISVRTFFLQELAWALLGWVLQMSLMALYQDRVGQEAAKVAGAAADLRTAPVD